MSKKVRSLLITILSAIIIFSIGAACDKKPDDSGVVGVPPTVISVPETKEIEVGTYSDFKADMAAILITDDNQEKLPYATKMPVSVKIGDNVSENADGFSEFLFDKVGEYTVKVEIKDVDGNVAYTEYKIKTVDTTAPEIVVGNLVYVWADNGSVVLPSPKVVDFSACTTQVAVKKDGVELTETDGKVSAVVGDTLNVTYTVKDASDNQAEKETVIKVIETGKLLDVNDVDAVKVFTAKEGVMETGNGLSYYYDGKTDVIEWRDGAYAFKEINENDVLSFTVANTKAAKVEIAVYAKVDGKKVAVGTIDVDPDDGLSTAKEYTVDIGELCNKTVDGWCLELNSLANMCFNVSDISLVKTQESTYQPDAEDNSLIGFEDNSAFNFKSEYNGGISKNEHLEFVANGLKSAKAFLKAGDSVGVLFQNNVNITSDANYLTLSLFAEKSGAIRIGIIIDGEEYSGAELELYAGEENQKGFFIDAVTLKNFKDKAIEGIFIYNQEKYQNTVYIDCVSVQNKTELLSEEIFNSPLYEYVVDKAEKFTVPNAIICDTRLISGVSVSNKLGAVELATYTPGEEADLSNFDSGSYTLTYTATDAFGKEHCYEILLTVTAGSLSGTVKFSNYYTDQEIVLPNPTLTSDVFGQAALENARIDKYYRAEGDSEWILTDGTLNFKNPTYIDVKYVVTVGEYRVSMFSNMYIHSKGVVMDYEKHTGGDYLGFRGHMYNSGTNKPKISTVWAKDGKYSLYVQHFTGWDDYNGVWETRYTLSEYVDTVVFWAYSQWDMKPATMYFDDYSTQSVTGAVEIMPGVHRYVVRLSKPIDRFDRWWVDVDKMHGFYIDNIYMYNSGDYEYPDMDGNRYNVSDGAVTFVKPKVTNVNTAAFTAEEIANIKYYLDVTNNNTTIKKTYEFTAEEIQLALVESDYTIKFRIIIGQTEYNDIQEISVTDLTCSFIKPLTALNANTEYKFALPVAEDGATVKAFISVYEKNEWNELTLDGDFAIVNLSTSGKYQVKFTVEKDGIIDKEIYDLTVRASNLIADFEVDESGAHHGTYGRDNGSFGYVSDAWAKDGDYSYYYNTGNHAMYEWIPTQTVTLDKAYNALAVDAKVVRNPVYGCTNLGQKIGGLEITLTTVVNGARKSFTSKQVIMPQGVNKYIFVFDYSFDNIAQFTFWTHYIWASSFYFDNITAETVDFPSFDAGNYVKTGESLTVEQATSSVDGVVTEVSYGLIGSENYQTLTAADGKFTVTFNKNGDYEIITQVKIGGNAFITRNTTVNVRDFDVNFIQPISTVDRGVEYEWTVYDSAQAGTTVSVYLKKAAETEWQKVTLNADGKTFKIKLSDADEYQLKYEAVNGSDTETEIYSIRSREDKTFIDFELDENGNHHGAGTGNTTKLTGSCYVTDEWSADGKYSYFFGYKAISLIAFTYYDANKYNKEHGWQKDGYLDLGEEYNAITVTIKAMRMLYGYLPEYDADGKPVLDANGYQNYVRGDGINLRVELREDDGTSRTIVSNAIIVPVGVGTYTFVFEEEFKNVYSIGFGLHYWMSTDFYVDAFKVEKIEYPELPNTADIGDKITVTAAEFNENTTTNVKYRFDGGAYINLGLIKGSFDIEVTDYGTMEIVVEVKINGTLVRTIKKAVTIANDPFADDLDWDGDSDGANDNVENDPFTTT